MWNTEEKKMDPKEMDTLKKSLTDFGNETTIHGLQYIVNKTNFIYRLCWLVIFCTFAVIFFIQGNLILQDFLTWPYSTKIDIVGRPNLAFPAVTLCNENMMRRSKIGGTRFQPLIDIDGGVEGSDYDYSWFFSSIYANYGWGYSSWNGGQSSFSESGSSSSDYNPSSEASSSGGSSGGSSYGHSISRRSSGQSSSSGGSSVGSSDGQSSSSGGSSAGSSYGQSSSSGGSSAGSSVGQSSSSGGSSAGSSVGQSSSSGGSLGGSSDGQISSSYGGRQYPGPGFSSSYNSFPPPNWGETWSWYNPSDYFDFEFSDNNWDGVTSREDWSGFYEDSKADDYSDFFDVINPTKEELIEYGHQIEDFIVQCTFDRRPCNMSRDFRVWQNRYYGNCFTFNSGISPDAEVIHTGKTGGLHGLHLTLFVEQPEYLGILSHQTGAKVAIHHPTEKPFPEDIALSVPTGHSTSIGMRQEFIKRLSGYYSNCTYDGTNTNFTSTNGYKYSPAACKKMCYQLHLGDLCGCVDDQLLDGHTHCDILNRTQQVCRKIVEEMHLDDKLRCSCPSPCEEFKYLRTPSSSIWPSERYEEHIFRRLNITNNEILTHILQSNDLSRKNILRLKIFYEDLNYEVVEMVPVYTIPSLLGSVGGLMGLYIGMSFISVFEVLFLVLRVIKIGLIRIHSRFNRVQPHTVQNL
ncbi:degenerin unc-8-like [Lytechinus variegatus]|uniref:degenerin unc-8-like n=1 Tax=Lytechinus variegatus TaxID=7654 RepID=UPI001BB0D884|nr:degenerin unc-8-like [Lytechinus variegatus]